jgi:hypothetical protein
MEPEVANIRRHAIEGLNRWTVAELRNRHVIINITKVFDTIVPVLKIEIRVPVDTLELALDSTTAAFCRILLLVFGFRSPATDNVLIQEALDWGGVQCRVTVRLNRLGNTDVGAKFLKTLEIVCLPRLAKRKFSL